MLTLTFHTNEHKKYNITQLLLCYFCCSLYLCNHPSWTINNYDFYYMLSTSRIIVLCSKFLSFGDLRRFDGYIAHIYVVLVIGQSRMEPSQMIRALWLFTMKKIFEGLPCTYFTTQHGCYVPFNREWHITSSITRIRSTRFFLQFNWSTLFYISYVCWYAF